MNKNTEHIFDGRATSETKYSYVIYVASFPAFLLLMRSLAWHRLNESPSADDAIFRMALMMIFCSLAWVVGRKYNLSYVARCALGSAATMLPPLIAQIHTLLEDKSFFLIIPLCLFGGVVFMGLGSFLISHPLQLLYLKVMRHFRSK